MQRTARTAAIFLAALFLAPIVGEAQTWPDRGTKDSGFEWIVGSYAPLSGLGSFDGYSLSMDPWLTGGISLRSGDLDDRLRTRFEVTAVPNVAMRRSPLDVGEVCEGCSPDSFRLTLLNSRFLFDLTFPFAADSRAYVTGGPAMRFQLSDPEECPISDGGECALPQFARSRIDPGVVAGVGWEPNRWNLRAIQLTGRLGMYGRAERKQAAPRSWLPELDLSIRFTL